MMWINKLAASQILKSLKLTEEAIKTADMSMVISAAVKLNPAVPFNAKLFAGLLILFPLIIGALTFFLYLQMSDETRKKTWIPYCIILFIPSIYVLAVKGMHLLKEFVIHNPRLKSLDLYSMNLLIPFIVANVLLVILMGRVKDPQKQDILDRAPALKIGLFIIILGVIGWLLYSYVIT